MMPVLQSQNPKRPSGFSIDSLISRESSSGPARAKATSPGPKNRSPSSLDPMTVSHAREVHHHQQQQQQRLAAAMALGATGAGHPHMSGSPGGGLPHPAFWGHSAGPVLSPGDVPPGSHPHMDSATLAHLFAHGVNPSAMSAGVMAGSQTGVPGFPPGLSQHGAIPQHLLGMAQKDNFPFYTWLLSRHGNLLNRGLSGLEAAYLFPFRKPKRIRTAFSPSQLLRLEHAFEKNHYVVGQERKDLAVTLNLTETQVKVWFQNRRTKYKRVQTEDGVDPSTLDDEPPESDCEDIDVDSPPSPDQFMYHSMPVDTDSNSEDELPRSAKMPRFSHCENIRSPFNVSSNMAPMPRDYNVAHSSVAGTDAVVCPSNVMDSVSKVVSWNSTRAPADDIPSQVSSAMKMERGRTVSGQRTDASHVPTLSVDKTHESSPAGPHDRRERVTNKRPWECSGPALDNNKFCKSEKKT